MPPGGGSYLRSATYHLHLTSITSMCHPHSSSTGTLTLFLCRFVLLLGIGIWKPRSVLGYLQKQKKVTVLQNSSYSLLIFVDSLGEGVRPYFRNLSFFYTFASFGPSVQRSQCVKNEGQSLLFFTFLLVALSLKSWVHGPRAQPGCEPEVRAKRGFPAQSITLLKQLWPEKRIPLPMFSLV